MTTSRHLRALCALAGVGLIATFGGHAAQMQRQLDAHEHGVTILNIALEGTTLYAELEGPAMNFVGFEYQPRTAAEQEAVTAALSALRGGRPVVEFLPAEACRLDSASAQHIVAADENNHDDQHTDSGHEDDDSSTGEHAEFTGEYTFTCAQPDELEAVRVVLFSQFELTDEVATSFIGPRTQVFRELTPTENVLSIEP